MYCHACNEQLLPPVLTLGDIPLVDKFLKDKTKSQNVLSSPLSLNQCKKCRTYQIGKIVDPKLLYSDYIYNSSSSPDLDDHFNEYADHIIQKLHFLERSKSFRNWRK